MESPVRICLGVVIVVNLLLLCGTAVDGGTIPLESTTIAHADEREPRVNRFNKTWIARNKAKTPDITLNELSPKDSTSEEHTEKNAKYKDRGRVRFGTTLQSTTNSPLRRSRSTKPTTTTSTEVSTLIIVTPTPEVKKPLQIIDSMRNYKKTKMPSSTVSTTPLSVKKESQSIEEFENRDESEDNDSFEQFITSKFDDNNFFTIPNFDDGDEFKHDSDNESADNKVKQDFSSPSYSYSSYFPKDSYSYKEDSSPFKSSFFDFDTELTTPKNDYFDKKFQQISTSIIKNLDSIKAKSPPPKMTNVTKIVKENIGLERLNNNTPSNKSSVFLKNTKEIRLLDNQGAGSANKELSDVQGTSIYYEMSVLSTETYAINHSNEDDCDNDTSALEATPSTSPLDELASIKATPSTSEETSKQTDSQSSESLSTVSSNFFPLSSVQPFNYVPVSTQNYVPTTERVTRVFSSSFTRNRNYSKRLNLTGTKDSPNSVTIKTESPVNTARPPSRKFHYTTPKTKPIWLLPRRNVTRVHPKPTNPTTIYSEHFDIKDKFKPSNIRQPSKAVLTTVPSAEIDPVLQSDISGIKKVVHSQSISDNTIPSLRKRGSSRFTTSTATSAENETDLSELEMPSTAWALASLISPPSQPNTVVNATENELQKVGDMIDKKETTVGSTSTTMAIPISNDIITKKVTEVDQNKLLWQPVYSPTSPSLDLNTTAENKHEIIAESNISETNAETAVTEPIKDNFIESKSKPKDVKPLWVPATVMEATTVKSEKENKTIQPVDSTKSTGFESITKLPADITTPQDETVASSEVNQTIIEQDPETTTDNFEITTIRFSYRPTATTEATDDEALDAETTTLTWHPALPTRTRLTTIQDEPITTYRPKYMTTTDTEETTTIIPDTTPVLEVSSQIVDDATDKVPEATTTIPIITEEVTSQSSTEIVTEPPTPAPTQAPTTTSTTTMKTTVITTTTPTTTAEPTTTPAPTTELPEDTTTTVVQVVTEINTEKATIITQSTSTEQSTETTETDCTSEENSDSNEIIHETKSTETESVETTTIEKNRAQIIVTTSPRPQTTTKEDVPVPTVPEITTTKTTTTTKLTTTEPVVRVETETANVVESTTSEVTTESGDESTKIDRDNEINEQNGVTYAEVTTEASSQVLPDEAGSGAAVAIAVSTIGVIALVLLIGLLLVVRRRGRRGIYAQRCTPVSLDAYSLDSVSVGHRKGNQRLRASKRSYGNPAYDDEVTSHPMQYPALANFALDVDSMTAEFAEIPSVSVRPEEVPPGCEDKNRYSNVLPLPETRVPLRRIGNDPTSEYINANYVTGPGNIRNYYILSQAPLANTVVDFWRMVWEQNSRLIVMLTEYMENGVEKCYEYLPPSEISDNKRTFGEYQIVLKKREQRDKYAISSVQVINLSTRTWREVTHLWYFWPANGVPEDYDSVIDFLFEMRSYMKTSQTAKEYDEEGVEVIYGDQSRSSFNNLSKFRSDSSSGNGVNVYSPARAEEQARRGGNNGTLSRMKAASEVEGIRPCIVTCASGAGRSAAVCALDMCARALHGGAADVPRTVRLLRTQRPHSLSNRHHYMFVYKVLSEYGNKVMGGGDTI